eukprot:IDg2661t1
MALKRSYTPKEIVTELMMYVGQEVEPAPEDPGSSVPKTFIIYECPKPGCHKQIRFANKSGFRNPYVHLKSCFARGLSPSGQDEKLQQIKQSTDGCASSLFKKIPVCAVQDSEFRSFSKFNVEISKATMVDVIFKLVEMVERYITEELSNTRGAIIYDGWTVNGMHYVGLFTSYIRAVPTRVSSTFQEAHTPTMTLLAVSPMSQITDGGEQNGDAETTKFNAEAHVKFFRDVFELYKCDFDKWCVCLVGDNASTNLRTAKLCSKPHVSCTSHKLNNENAAILRNLTELRPVMHNQTRWSGKFNMLQRFERLRDELISASQDVNADIHIDDSAHFLRKVTKYRTILGEINVVTKVLQKENSVLAMCRDSLDCLIEAVEEQKNIPQARLYGCMLGKKYIGQSTTFEKAVVKIQKGLKNELSASEKFAAKCLLVHETADEGESPKKIVSMQEMLTKRRKVQSLKISYINCDFILGSVAIVERLWSCAHYIYSDYRRSMTPQLLEALLFLRANERLWDAQL